MWNLAIFKSSEKENTNNRKERKKQEREEVSHAILAIYKTDISLNHHLLFLYIEWKEANTSQR